MADTPESAAQPDLARQVPVDQMDALKGFLSLSKWEVEAEALRSLSRTSTGTTWMGLSTLMQRRGYTTVEALGTPAAIVWARHLGIISKDRSAS
jgi:hypothetical protein